MSLRNLSVVALAGLIACVIGLYVRQTLLASGPVTITIQVVAALLWFWARLTFGIRSFHGAANPTTGGIVRTGPYRYLRHPIYAAILYFVWAGIASNPSLSGIGLGLVASAMTALRIIAEEKLLVMRYAECEEYAQVTSRLVPFVF